MKNRLLIGLIAIVFSAQAMTGQSVVAERQKLFNEIEDDTEVLEDLMTEANWDESAKLSNKLVLDIARLKQLFPKASIGDGRSKDKVWREWTEFEGRLTDLSSFYQRAEQASKTHNVKALAQAVDDANSTCRGCHMKYRSIW